MNVLTKKNKKIIAAVAIVAAVIIIIVSGSVLNKILHSLDCGVQKAEDGSIDLKVNLNELQNYDIHLGDSLDVEFDTGFKVEDVALVSGPYFNAGRYICVADDEQSNIVFQVQNTDYTWAITSAKENTISHLTLKEKGKYKYLNDAFNMPIIGDTKNFRSLRGGNIRYLDIYRGANPSSSVDNESKLSYYLKNLSIFRQINLNDNNRGVNYFDIKNISCNALIVDTLKAISNDDTHTFICSNDEDFTAYVCAICLAISGASYEEIVADYMETYKNLYGITIEEMPDLYNAIKTFHIDDFLHQLTKTPLYYDLSKCDYAYYAEMYLRAQQVHTSDINKIKQRFSNL